ncbi:hypothetical protein BGZ83_002160 [Gryganskiella cystojenkinii]|nr:hypothetical protein BGZ83_002160 [Gryganskiella cystojenkinii]
MDRTSTCPQLVNFSLKVPSSVSTLTKTTTTTDDEIVPFLILRMCLAPIQELTLGGSLFGSRCGQELLEQDGSSLRILELKDCPGVSSTMAHQLLCHLPNLESFSAPLVQDWDVKLDGEHDWVSLGLKKLCLGLDWLEIMSSVTENHGLFKQLGRLAALKSLMVTRYRCPVSKDLLDTYTHSALRFGQALRSLPDLETLDLTDTTQKFMEEDVSWMMDNWPSLKVVTGMLHSDQEMDLVLRTMFESQGVRKTAAKPSKVWIS